MYQPSMQNRDKTQREFNHYKEKNMSIIATTMAMVTEQIMEPETIIQRFSRNYGQIHGWTSAVTCLFGIPCNLLNIIVLSQPNMIKSPTNLILVGLAFTDLGTMLMYLPIGIYFYILKVCQNFSSPIIEMISSILKVIFLIDKYPKASPRP